MGGDFGPRLTVPSAVSSLLRYPHLRLQLYGDESLVAPVLAPLLAGSSHAWRDRLEVIHCPQVVAMDEKPAQALRRKRDSSLWHALRAVAESRADACVSAGNTGALMAMGMSLLGKLPGIDRPAICTAMPTPQGRAYLLDMGANIGCDADHLVQFAHMASAMVQVVESIPEPRVALLNVGHEEDKGEAVVREAAVRLAGDARINYHGFVEGDGIFSGAVDIIVCDGFVGNVALKSSEGVARMIGAMLKDSLNASLAGKIGAFFARAALASLKSRIDPSLYNGASLLGLNGVVIKSHGGATQAGFENALTVAISAARQDVPQRIVTRLESLQPQP
ncbi:MAG: hypothetical protein VR73_14045 [Gammaproteobacteria bacterium BRH_c0]|nr:MAG: hypothetical protein VR73_14045 [Gammaproteobacteria bacterium BRH_c0]